MIKFIYLIFFTSFACVWGLLFLGFILSIINFFCPDFFFMNQEQKDVARALAIIFLIISTAISILGVEVVLNTYNKKDTQQ